MRGVAGPGAAHIMALDDELLDDERPEALAGRRRTRLLTRLAVAFAVVFLLACVGVAALILGSQKTVADEPAAVAAIAGGITPLELPPALAPHRALEIRVPFRRRPLMAWAHFLDKASDSSVVVAEIGDPFNEHDLAKIRERVEQSLREQGIPVRKIIPEQNKMPSINVDGQSFGVRVVSGRAPLTNQPRIQAQLYLEGRLGDTLLVLLSLDAQRYPEPQVAELLGPVLRGVAAARAAKAP